MANQPILVVDDEAQNLALLRQILRNDYHLVFAKSGKEAITAVHKHMPSLILLDITLPDLDGYQVCQKLKSDINTAAIPIIFVTSHAEMEDEIKGSQAGGADYIIKPVIPELVKLRVANHLSLVRASIVEQSYADAIEMLGIAGHYNDTDTGQHVWRMASLAKLLAEKAGLDSRHCDMIEKAATMHDTGKIGIPDRILRKPGKLDPDEWTVMKTHTDIGFEILSRSKAPVFKIAASIALNHHEKWDGSGYPKGISEEQIPLEARIVMIADVFDALTMERSYKKAWPLEDAFTHIAKSGGTHFDPKLVELFMSYEPEVREIHTFYKTKEQAL